MCFYINKRKGTYDRTPVALTAQEPILCYKTVSRIKKTKSAYSAFQGFKYTLGKQVSETFDITHKPYGPTDTIDRGLHSYNDLKTAKRLQGRDTIMVCIIPVGAQYYENKKNKQYCSTEIIPVSFL